MSRLLVAVSLVLLGGCGSCLDDKKDPAMEGPPTVKTVTKTTESGKRPVVVGDGFKFSDVGKRDGGAEQRP